MKMYTPYWIRRYATSEQLARWQNDNAELQALLDEIEAERCAALYMDAYMGVTGEHLEFQRGLSL